MRAAATKAKTRLSKRVTKDSEKKERSLAVIELERKKYKSFIGGINSINEILDNHRPTKKYLNATGSSEIKSKLSPYLFRPDESRKVIWDIWIASLIMFSIIDIPLRIGFQIPSDSGAEIFDYILDGFFFVDILANFNTIIIENNDKMIINRNIIAFRYLKFWFWLDLISTMPFDNIVESVLNQNAGNALTAVRLIRIVRLVRLLKLVRVFRLRNISEHMEKLQIHPAILNVLKLLFQVFLIAHIVSCFWYFLTTGDVVGFNTTTGEVQKINTWITDHPLIDNGDLGTKYVASLYWYPNAKT